MSLAQLKVATAEQLEKAIGFDGKFVIGVGQKVTFNGANIIYAEESATLKTSDGKPAVTTFFAWEEGTKMIHVTTGSLSRNRVPAGYNVTRTEGTLPENSVPVFEGSTKLVTLPAKLNGTYELVCKQSYTGFSMALKQMVNGTAYHWAKI
jgi:hypothetical protein